MSAYYKPDRCAWCRARLTPQNAAVVGPHLVCVACASARAVQQQRQAMKDTCRGMGGQ